MDCDLAQPISPSRCFPSSSLADTHSDMGGAAAKISDGLGQTNAGERSLDKEQEEEEFADVRILVVGDAGVGKTSIITSLLDDEFHENVPACFETVSIPREVTPDGVFVKIRDYSPRVQSDDELATLINWANVIAIVYSILDEKSIQQVTSYWLPLVQRTLGGPDHGRPVLLVANKSDSPNGVANEISKMVKIMNEFLEIETVVECSAKILKNVSEIFMYAQKAVIYPFRPLFHVEERELTHKCKQALARIFKISDVDNDGLLSDEELKVFQMRCFGIPLTRVAIEGVKQVILEYDNRGVLDESLTIGGFFYLHQLFIQRGKYDTVWTILRRFGYDLDLQLAHDYLLPKLKIPKGCSTEISPTGLNFITQIFRKYDEDKDNCLSPTELQNLFSVCPASGWSKELLHSVETNCRSWLTFNGYINLWTLNFAINLPQALEHLAYLGFNVEHKSQVEAVLITRERHVDVTEKQTSRRVFKCHVIGPKGAGKTVFCRSLISMGMEEVTQLTRKQLLPYVMNVVKIKDNCRHLLLHEVDVYSQNELLTSYEKSADVICLLYDATNPDSFAYCATIYLRYFYRTKVPCLFVATRANDFLIEQNYEQQPIDFCLMHQLPKPVYFRSTDIGRADAAVFSRLATMANFPHLKRVYFLQDSNLLSKITFGAAVAALAGFLIYKNL